MKEPRMVWAWVGVFIALVALILVISLGKAAKRGDKMFDDLYGKPDDDED